MQSVVSRLDKLRAVTRRPSPVPAADESPRELALAMAVAAKATRRQRTETFPHLRLREPMWDVMLDLFIAHERGQRVPLEHLALYGEIEPAVAHHAVAVLVTTGLVERVADPLDPRSTLLLLTPAGLAGMVEHFTDAARHMRPCAMPAARRKPAAA